MNKAALKKHEIYNKLLGLTGQELGTVAEFIDFVKHKKNKTPKKKIIKLQGIMKGYDVNLDELKTFKKASWLHLEKEFGQ